MRGVLLAAIAVGSLSLALGRDYDDVQTLGAGEFDSGVPAKKPAAKHVAAKAKSASAPQVQAAGMKGQDDKKTEFAKEQDQKQWHDAVKKANLAPIAAAVAAGTHWSQLVKGAGNKELLNSAHKKNGYPQDNLPHHKPTEVIPLPPKKVSTKAPKSLQTKIDDIEKDQLKSAKHQVSKDEKTNEKLEEKIQAAKFINIADDKQDHLAERMKQQAYQKTWKRAMQDKKLEVKDKDKAMDLKMQIGISKKEVKELENL